MDGTSIPNFRWTNGQLPKFPPFPAWKLSLGPLADSTGGAGTSGAGGSGSASVTSGTLEVADVARLVASPEIGDTLEGTGPGEPDLFLVGLW